MPIRHQAMGAELDGGFRRHPLVTNLVIGVLVLVGIARRAVKQSCVFCQFPLSAWLVAAIYGYAFITTLWAPDSQSSLAEWVRLGPYIVTVTVLAPLLLSDLADIRIAFQWTVYVGGAVCLLALVFGKWGFRGLLLNGDLYETETNPLALASLGGVVLLAAATLMLQKKHLVLKIINIACIPLALAVILKSGSRGQLLATGPAFVVAWLIAFRLKNVGSVAALLLTACFVVGIGVWAATIVEVDSRVGRAIKRTRTLPAAWRWRNPLGSRICEPRDDSVRNRQFQLLPDPRDLSAHHHTRGDRRRRPDWNHPVPCGVGHSVAEHHSNRSLSRGR